MIGFLQIFKVVHGLLSHDTEFPSKDIFKLSCIISYTSMFVPVNGFETINRTKGLLCIWNSWLKELPPFRLNCGILWTFSTMEIDEFRVIPMIKADAWDQDKGRRSQSDHSYLDWTKNLVIYGQRLVFSEFWSDHQLSDWSSFQMIGPVSHSFRYTWGHVHFNVLPPDFVVIYFFVFF